tara:strand:- start:333 stop:587 length:255 start_codon:yes stop_codon:yes gene_type:complete
MVPDPENNEEGIPRLLTYIEEKDFAPVEIIDDEKYVPTGAVLGSGLYGSANSDDSSETEQFCSECGGKNSSTAKFCRECGTNLV